MSRSIDKLKKIAIFQISHEYFCSSVHVVPVHWMNQVGELIPGYNET